MPNSDPVIDLAELVSATPGQGLEELVRKLGERKGLSPSWSGRGADGGRDLYFTEIREGPISRDRTLWLVSCKDKARSGASVAETDLPKPGIRDKLDQHKADGFLLVTTTTVGTAAKGLLDGLDKNNGGPVHILVWDAADITQMLLEPENIGLVQQFFPASYKRMQAPDTAEAALKLIRASLPADIAGKVEELVSPHLRSAGHTIWPGDSASATVIDDILALLIDKQDVPRAATETGKIGHEAFGALVEYLLVRHPESVQAYLMGVTEIDTAPVLAFNATKQLFSRFELAPHDRLRIMQRLDSASLLEIVGPEIAGYITSELINNTMEYRLGGEIDQLSSATRIGLVSIESMEFDVTRAAGIAFSGDLTVTVVLEFDGDEVGEDDLPGHFEGYFDQHGTYLEDASVDTRSVF